MIALNPLAALLATAPPTATGEVTPGRTTVALIIVAAVLAAAVVTETIRHHHRRRVHHPIPLPRRATLVNKDRSTRDLASRTELVAHRP